MHLTIIIGDIDASNSTTNATIDAKNKMKVECAPKHIPENEVLYNFSL